ncbi:hypothetical protein PIB30_116238, partial [Stylosanthes scabra]|nr:hypothetical protein [Stylosanthes scabra]
RGMCTRQTPASAIPRPHRAAHKDGPGVAPCTGCCPSREITGHPQLPRSAQGSVGGPALGI